MKRIGYLWDQMISLESLLAAAQRARRGKRFRRDVCRFEFNREREICKLHDELKTKSYRPGPYRTFYVYEPKRRLISAAPYRDRVVHHALTTTLQGIFEPTFSGNSFACRTGKGTHAAVRRAQAYARQYRFVWKADIKKFFPSMDHQILLDVIRRKIKDPHVLWLIETLVAASNPQEEPDLGYFAGDDLFTQAERKRGIPIGNQTSQFFANVYLNPLDHFIADRLGFGASLRYVDDFLVFGDSKQQLWRAAQHVAEFLEPYRLRIHPTKNVVFPTTCGISFLGYRVFPSHLLLAKSNLRRFRRRMRVCQRQYATGKISPDDIKRRLMSWTGHASQADTYRLRVAVLGDITFTRKAIAKPGVARRLVQQQRVESAFGQPQQQPPR